jgi:hypothetical protein
MDDKTREEIKREAGNDEKSNYEDALINLTEKAVREELLFTCECEGCKKIDVRKAVTEEIFNTIESAFVFTTINGIPINSMCETLWKKLKKKYGVGVEG